MGFVNNTMKRTIIYIIFLNTTWQTISQELFEKYFSPGTLRIDYIQSGNADTSYYSLDQVKQEPYWGGSKTNLVDTFGYGTNITMIYDSSSNDLIYSRGYATLCSEWQTTQEAKQVFQSFEETVTIPLPKKTIKVVIRLRDRNNIFHTVFEHYLNPSDYMIRRESYNNYKTSALLESGDPANNIDMVILPDGYTAKEMDKFKRDANRFSAYLLSWGPFDKYKDRFNFWMVEVPSVEKGTDIPGNMIWANTAFNTSFYTFGSERYLTTAAIKRVRDAAGHVPYDQIYILVNSALYGGGGIFNFYGICSSDHEDSEFVFCHEFGHSFAGLADEYYTSETSYIDSYNKEVEPYQPNITTLVDFSRKWKFLIDEGTPIPTPASDEYINKVGVFEGGGYSPEGIYRPTYNSSMRSGIINDFGPVNERAIEQMILFYIR